MGQDNQKITFVLTSCGRFDLLEKTLASFFQHPDAKMIDHFILTEDSGNEGIYDVLKKFPVEFEVILNDPPKGQFPSIDLAYSKVETPYIFHCEDDWEFTRPGFMQPSLDLLEDFPEFVQVLVRDPAEEKHGSTDGHVFDHKGIKHYRPDPKNHFVWYGYSFNPGLRRTKDGEKIGDFRFFLEETQISIRAKEVGFCQAMLVDGGVKHIGKHRHVPEVFISRRNVFQRLKNSIIKRTVGFPVQPKMTGALPISCFIVAQNEEQRIERALVSVKGLVDEIILVDSGSTDKTIEIAKSYGAHIFFKDWEGDGPQKRFAESKCRNNWVLNIDADEWLNLDLIENIRRLFENDEPKKSVWCLQRADIYFGDRTVRWHMNREKMPRFYDKRKTGFTPKKLHTSVPHNKGNAGVLKGTLLHAPAFRVRDMVAKEINYAHIGVKDKSLLVLLFRLYVDFFQCFFKHYLLRNHIFGGKKGWTYSMIRAYARFLRTAVELEKKLRWVTKEKLRYVPPPLSAEELAEIEPIQVSGFVVAQDEEERLGRALHTMQKLGLDEMVVVDSGSSDKTQEIAQSYGAKVVDKKWLGFIGNQKRFAEQECRNDWIFNLDADEWLNDKAIKSIRKLFAKGTPKFFAYKIDRNDLYIGKKYNFPRLKGHSFIRLYNKTKMSFKPDRVIDNIDYEKKYTGKVRGRMLHIAVKSMGHVAEKENNYSNLEQERIEKSDFNLAWRVYMEMPLFFVKFYIMRGGVFGGLQGFCYSIIYSFARFQRIVKLMERKKTWRN